MNKVLVSISLIALLSIVGNLIAKFFDVPMSFYMPLLVWLIGLCLFDIFLDRDHISLFFKSKHED